MRSIKVFFSAACALVACSVGDFPARRDAGSAVDVPADSTPTPDRVVPPDVTGLDASDASDGSACSGSSVVCEGACVDTATNNRHCGRCGHDCTLLPHVNGSVACVAGRCSPSTACAAGFAHCTAVEDDGCETDISQGPHCGGCATACAEPTPVCALAEPIGADASTDASTDATADATADATIDAPSDAASDASGDVPSDAGARYACRSGCGAQARCSMACVDTRTSITNCGSCGNNCPAASGAATSCVDGRCGFTCATGFGDCDMSPATGCETDTRTSTLHCGRCGAACPARANATVTCASGACGISCASGFSDCDRAVDNGCEVDTRLSVSNCGTCGNVCPAGANATPVCRSGACAITCASGFSDCDGDPSNGCEVSIRSNINNCGMCGRTCAGGPNATATCTAGVCGIVCRAPFANCDSFDVNGCETDVTSTLAHCGTCGNACPALPGSNATCTTGTCGYTCQTRYGDCDSVRANGCETDLFMQGNCGRCGRTCGMTCFMGICIPEG